MERASSNSAVGLFLTQSDAVPMPLDQEMLALFDLLRMPVLRYAVSFGLAQCDGEDILQEVFLALFHHLRKRRSRSNLRAWIFRVTHNLALRRRMLIQSRARLTQLDAYTPEEHYTSELNPEEIAIAGEQHADLLRVYRTLPDRDQRCLQLRAEGLTYREIAGVVGVSLGTVATILVRSLSRLGQMNAR
ncbi:RNA polymerase sigma factor [Granulicella arctica]|uniref:RNA polymerase sigma factor n=1 Tax=Granulicella arctica TaxID=940613 RepID=UPI0021E0D0A5|nr:sigma-70 family RNA polymerase sigma factor [Granulicella arctica]